MIKQKMTTQLKSSNAFFKLNLPSWYFFWGGGPFHPTRGVISLHCYELRNTKRADLPHVTLHRKPVQTHIYGKRIQLTIY